MTKKQKLALIKRLYKRYSRNLNYNVLCKKYGLAREYVRYHLEKGYKELIIKNAVAWRNKNIEKYRKYHREYKKK